MNASGHGNFLAHAAAIPQTVTKLQKSANSCYITKSDKIQLEVKVQSIQVILLAKHGWLDRQCERGLFIGCLWSKTHVCDYCGNTCKEGKAKNGESWTAWDAEVPFTLWLSRKVSESPTWANQRELTTWTSDSRGCRCQCGRLALSWWGKDGY